jgi:hypothetical protein
MHTGLARIEAEAEALAGRVDIGTITLGCVLGYLDLRFAPRAAAGASARRGLVRGLRRLAGPCRPPSRAPEAHPARPGAHPGVRLLLPDRRRQRPMTPTELLAHHPRPDAAGLLFTTAIAPSAPAELADESARLAGALQALGVGRGDRVAVWAAQRHRLALRGLLRLRPAGRDRGGGEHPASARPSSPTSSAFYRVTGAVHLAGLQPGRFRGHPGRLPAADSLARVDAVIAYDEGRAQAAARLAELRAALPCAGAPGRLRAVRGRRAPARGPCRATAWAAAIFTTSGTHEGAQVRAA